MAKKVTMQDIADRLNISKNAVSLALNHKPGVGEELRDEIFRTAKELGYIEAQKAAVKKKHLLVLNPERVEQDKIFYYYEIFWAIERRAQENGYNVVISGITQAMNEALELPDVIGDLPFSGILLLGEFTPAYAVKLKSAGIPVISVDHVYDAPQLNAVTTANGDDACSLVRSLTAQGHIRIGFVGDIRGSRSVLERWYGYDRALRDAGLRADPACSLTEERMPERFDSVWLSERLQRMQHRPTAWFCANDRLAIELMKSLASLGIRVPADVSVVGFDDIEAAALITPALTTVKVHREEMGAAAVDFLLEAIDNKVGPSIRILYGELMVRESAGPAPAAEV